LTSVINSSILIKILLLIAGLKMYYLNTRPIHTHKWLTCKELDSVVDASFLTADLNERVTDWIIYDKNQKVISLNTLCLRELELNRRKVSMYKTMGMPVIALAIENGNTLHENELKELNEFA
jgi:hypothetical protein